MRNGLQENHGQGIILVCHFMIFKAKVFLNQSIIHSLPQSLNVVFIDLHSDPSTGRTRL